MTLNEKIVNYKVLDLVILYNFGTKIDIIRDHIKKIMKFFCVESFVGRAMPSPTPKNGFVETGEAITRPYKCHHF